MGGGLGGGLGGAQPGSHSASMPTLLWESQDLASVASVPPKDDLEGKALAEPLRLTSHRRLCLTRQEKELLLDT